jgi:hypothetical protein
MSDLVERMRKEVVQDNFVGLLDEAAARIETLEAALRQIAGQMLVDEHDEDYNGDYEAGYEAIVRIARAALAEGQDK